RAPHRRLRRPVRPRPPRRPRSPTEGLNMSDAQAPQPQPASFQIEKMYVKDLSLEIPHAPAIFTEQVQPEIQVQINTEAQQFGDGYYEVTVTATVTAKMGERTIFLAEAEQAGIFSLRNVPASDIGPLLGIACPT